MQETLDTEQTGMTPELEQEAVALRENIGKRALALSELRRDRKTRTHVSSLPGLSGKVLSGPTATGNLIDDIDQTVKKHQLNGAKRKAKKRYRQNEGAYQEQAANEAYADDVELNGWSQK